MTEVGNGIILLAFGIVRIINGAGVTSPVISGAIMTLFGIIMLVNGLPEIVADTVSGPQTVTIIDASYSEQKIGCDRYDRRCEKYTLLMFTDKSDGKAKYVDVKKPKQRAKVEDLVDGLSKDKNAELKLEWYPKTKIFVNLSLKK